MKASPALFAIGAAGIAALILFRPKPAAAAPAAPSSVPFLSRVQYLGDFVSESWNYARYGDPNPTWAKIPASVLEGPPADTVTHADQLGVMGLWERNFFLNAPSNVPRNITTFGEVY